MGAISDVLVEVFKWIHSVLGDWGFSIVIFTILFKIVLLPFNIMQTKSTVKMQMVQPKLKELQKKYKSDPKKLQEEQMKLYKSEGVNPFAGCLPMLIQLPVLWAVYYVFRDQNVLNLFQQSNAMFLGLPLASNVNSVPYLGVIFAVISGGSTFLSTWLLTPRNKDNKDSGSNPMASNTTNIIMSAFFGWISWTMPAGIVVYWIVNNLLQLGIQFALNNALRKKAQLAVDK